ncbi:MAG: GPR endopeptidase [Oscillospiraceae bacterium]|nr:GPR endopeptidase [Oscillospiraceae bacterium]
MPFRTDLAMEGAQPHSGNLPNGITQDERSFGNLKINTVEVTDQEAAQLIGKPQGKYVTVITPPFHSAVDVDEEEIIKIADEISSFLPKDGLALVVGLGNNDITPDAIGPRTVHQVLATRHFNAEAAKQAGLGDLRPTAAIAPGVLGQTGIETSEIIKSIVNDIKPSVVIVIDALAARDTSRLGNTIQIADSGISPGSGVQNSRKELSTETLGIPVVSIGIPTVVDATTFANDIMSGKGQDTGAPLNGNPDTMMITPREIDVLIGHACKTLALAINKALHSEMTLEEISYLVS